MDQDKALALAGELDALTNSYGTLFGEVSVLNHEKGKRFSVRAEFPQSGQSEGHAVITAIALGGKYRHDVRLDLNRTVNGGRVSLLFG